MCLEAAKLLARQCASLILIGSNAFKGESARNELIKLTGNENIHYLCADLSLAEETYRIGKQIRAQFNHIDILVLGTGGVYPKKRKVTAEGLEFVFALQYLSRFQFSNEMMDLLYATDDPKVIQIAGGGSIKQTVDMDNIQGEKVYSKLKSISRISPLNDVLTAEQINRFEDVKFYNYGPGLVRTNIIMGDPIARLFFNTVGRLFTRSSIEAGNDIVNLVAGNYASGFYGADN